MRALPLALAALAVCACSEPEPTEVAPYSSLGRTARTPEKAEPVVVRGHVVDRSTREPVIGARVEGPGGRSAVSGNDGFFELTGFDAGEGGELSARMTDGRVASTTLRPLQPGALEVVLHLGD